ncbi:MAG: LacI family DNA-binding transcriptional regulator [Planctomycetota bacterium]|nr:LacI family DNA-binding transcriptional regulator [Planctomycetota bacterium]
MAVALKQVAGKAGVSLAVASMAIRGRGRMSDETRAKVKKVAVELGFRPNASARALALGRSEALGVIVRDLHYLSGPYVGLIVTGIAEVSDDNDLGLSFARSAETPSRDVPEYIRFAREGRFDGMIMIDHDARESYLRLLGQMNMPAVLVNRTISDRSLPVVRINYRKAVAQATSHLIDMGHRRIALIAPYFKFYEYREKLAGYKDALESHGLSLDRQLMPTSAEAFLELATLRQVVEKLESLPDRPTAYIALSDLITVPLYEVLKSRSLRVPEDVSLIGFDHFGSTTCSMFPIGIINVPAHDLGVHACQLLLNLLKGKGAAKDVVLDATFEPRSTCAPPGR